MFTSRPFRALAILASFLMVFSVATVDQAEARRGGSFGSRGSRTFQTAPTTQTSPNQVSPVERSVTPRTNTQTTATPTTRNQPGSAFGTGFGGNLMRGLFFGGLLGLFLGTGFGGFAGFFGLLLQVLLIGGAIFLLLRLLRPRAALAGGPAASPYAARTAGGRPNLGGLGGSTRAAGTGSAGPGRRPNDALGLGNADLDRFEQLLTAVQDAYGREDYEALRRLATPEVASFLAQELGENASRGLKNEVSEVKLLKGDIAESWREGNLDYATAALRYASVDVTRERAGGRVVEGDPEMASETTELWTFVRSRGGPWQVSAIQQA